MIIRGLSEIKVKSEMKEIKIKKIKIKDMHDPKLSPKRGFGWSE